MKKNTNTVIAAIIPGSIAEEAGLEAGDRIISINGQIINDIFDYKFFITDECLTLKVSKKDGDIWEIDIEKEEYEDLGIEFENPMIDDARSCTNKCIFCFIDQLPPGMRQTLYFKDDDSRLSFLMGNYVTLTNMDDNDIDRIIKYRMSPVNVSVHTTNPDLRVFMLNNRFAGSVMEKINKLVDGGITVNCQIVLCRDINDGQELDRTINDLAELYPGVGSISVVPVGITKYREGLYELKPFDRDSANAVIEQVEKWQEKFLEKYQSRIVYLADELYLLAGRNIPPYEYYEDFPQIENGVGLIAMFDREFHDALAQLGSGMAKCTSRTVSIATGTSSYEFIKHLAEKIEDRCKNIKVNVYKIKNDFFGENVTVTGLLTGKDIAGQLSGRELGDELLISKSTLKSGEEIFLDDYTVSMLEEELGVKVKVVECNGRDFLTSVINK
ncbi:MAG TPA: DUF512 domain-containing protein [Clostridiaceae bacterium]|nr:DUF512 domain-containing protein [Clostridiaceae bacterium]